MIKNTNPLPLKVVHQCMQDGKRTGSKVRARCHVWDQKHRWMQKSAQRRRGEGGGEGEGGWQRAGLDRNGGRPRDRKRRQGGNGHGVDGEDDEAAINDLPSQSGDQTGTSHTSSTLP